MTSNFNSADLTYTSIDNVKQLGQRYYHQRIARQQRMNPRQLKKLRKKQKDSGTVGSKFGAICQVQLRPASAPIFKKD